MRRRSSAAVALAVLLALPGLAAAEEGSASRDGKTLTVSKASGLAVEGETVRVRGSGYDTSKGVYVAFCVDNGEGEVPTPCGGGADTEGSSGNSVWISDFPPAYGAGLAQPYGDGGSFDVSIRVAAVLRADDPETEPDETVDCRTARCAVVTRNDHTRSDDRGQDVVVPVSFATAAAPVASRSGSAARTAEPAGAPAPRAAPLPSAGSPTTTAPSPGATPSAADPPPTTSAAAAAEPVAPDEARRIAPSSADEGLPAVGLAALPALGLLAAASMAVRRRLRRTGAE